MIRHECGLLGIYGHEEAARLTYFGLYAQQHRGQESAGIVTIDEKGLLHEHKGMGLVPDVFAEANLQALPGTISTGPCALLHHGAFRRRATPSPSWPTTRAWTSPSPTTATW